MGIAAVAARAAAGEACWLSNKSEKKKGKRRQSSGSEIAVFRLPRPRANDVY
jgi:hypothetical protein